MCVYVYRCECTCACMLCMHAFMHLPVFKCLYPTSTYIHLSEDTSFWAPPVLNVKYLFYIHLSLSFSPFSRNK